MAKSNNAFLKNWLNYFVAKDTYSKLLLVGAVVAGIVWWQSEWNRTAGIVFAGLLVITVFASLIFFLLIGTYRTKTFNKFYDQIYGSAGLASSYSGREKSKVILGWKGRRVTSVAVQSASNSSVAHSATHWKNIKTAARETLPLVGETVYAVFDEHSRGKVKLIALPDNDLKVNQDTERLAFDEEFYNLVYETMASYNQPFPTVHDMETGYGANGDMLPERVTIRTQYSIRTYEQKKLESQLRSKYSDYESLWVFDWKLNEVTVRKVSKGSAEEMGMSTFQSVKNIIQNAMRRGFIVFDDDDYIFTPDMLDTEINGLIAVNGININFLQFDLSASDRVETFEQMMTRGLVQIMPGSEWNYEWTITAYEKSLQVTRQS